MLQIDFMLELFEKAKALGINTCLDTAAQPFTRQEPFFSKFTKLMGLTDLVLLDIKHIDNQEHKKLTGWDNTNVLDCASYLSQIQTPVWIRHVLVPGITDDDALLHELARFIGTLNNVERVEVLPYHTLGVYKYEKLGMDYPLRSIGSPTPERVENATRILRSGE